jgi:hypothetical protein
MSNMPDDLENRWLAELDGYNWNDDSGDGSDDGSDDGSGMLQSEAQRLASNREHQRLLYQQLHELHPGDERLQAAQHAQQLEADHDDFMRQLHARLQRMNLSDDHAAGAAAGAAADTAALDLPPVAEEDESRDYWEHFKCCSCLESKALENFVVADCGHAVLCRECWAQNQQTERRDVCPWCRHSVRRWCRTRLWPTTNKMMVLHGTNDTITTRAAFNGINPYAVLVASGSSGSTSGMEPMALQASRSQIQR